MKIYRLRKRPTQVQTSSISPLSASKKEALGSLDMAVTETVDRVAVKTLESQAALLDPFTRRAMKWGRDGVARLFPELRGPGPGLRVGIILPADVPFPALHTLSLGALLSSMGASRVVLSVDLDEGVPDPALAQAALLGSMEVLQVGPGDPGFSAIGMMSGLDIIWVPATAPLDQLMSQGPAGIRWEIISWGSLAVVADPQETEPELLARDARAWAETHRESPIYLLTHDDDLAQETLSLLSAQTSMPDCPGALVVTESREESRDLLEKLRPSVAYLAVSRPEDLLESLERCPVVFLGRNAPPASLPPLPLELLGPRGTRQLIEEEGGIPQEAYALALELGLDNTARALALRPFRIVRLHSNELAVALPDRVEQEARERGSRVAWNRYPTLSSPDLCRALADYTGFDPDWLAVGAGCDELILSCALAFRNHRWLISWPDFWVYRQTAEWTGIDYSLMHMDKDFGLAREDILDHLKTGNPEATVVVASNPNNPTGQLFGAGDLQEFLERGAWLILDEAYYEYGGFTAASWLERYPKLIILRTLSKAFGIAGLRVGYVLGHPPTIETLKSRKLALSVTSYSQEVAVSLLENRDKILPLVSRVREEREHLSRSLTQLGFRTYPSVTNFILVETGDAENWVKKLGARGYVVRSFPMIPGLRDHIRITVGSREENEGLIWTLKDLRRTPRE